MHQLASQKSELIAAAIHRDVRALFQFLYGTQKRSRITILVSLAVYGYCLIGAAIHGAMQAQGVCGM